MNSKNSVGTKKLVLLAILTAILMVLQFVAAQIRLGTFSITLALTPIIIGAALCGVTAGMYLGLLFGVVVLITGDAALFMAVSVPGTIVTVLMKGMLAGLVSGLVYKLVEKKNQYIAALLAGIVSPIVNTGVFFIGCLLFFSDFCVQFAASGGVTGNIFYVIAVFFIGGNFFVELAVNVVLAGTIVTLVKNGRKILRLDARG